MLILGAFGCGAFRTPPYIAANIFAEMTKEYREFFEVIEYAVFHKEHETENFKAFKGRDEAVYITVNLAIIRIKNLIKQCKKYSDRTA